MVAEHNTPALLIVAHGSTEREEDNSAVIELAQQIRRDGEFSRVEVGFIKAAPDARAKLEALAGDVVIVPLLMSEGFFYSSVLPKKLGLTSLESMAVVEDGGRRVVYAEPVGTHANVVGLVRGLVHQARELFDIPDRPHLLLVGHGTEQNPQSSAPTRQRAVQLAEDDAFSQVSVAFLDEAPYLEDVLAGAADDLLVVPDFVGEGLHTRIDIPEALGLEGYEGGFATVESNERRVWYTPAVGAHPAVGQIIAIRARQAAGRL